MSLKNGKGYEIRAKASKEAEIFIYDEIGSDWWGGVSAKQIKNELQALGEMDKIAVHIHSPGGDVFDSMTIYNLLKQNSALIEVYVDGSAFSGASIIAMAGDQIFMAENSMMMIHEPWTFAMGFAADMLDAADRLDKVKGMMVKTYCKRCGKTEGEVADLLAAETWLTPEEAVEMGFADSIIEPMKMAAHFDLEKFKYRQSPCAKKSEHYIEKCEKCDKTISSCRCSSENKTIRYSICEDCKQPEAVAKPVEEGPPMQPRHTPDLAVFDYGINRCTEILNQGAKS